MYGSLGLELAPLRHEALRELTFESAGLPADVVRAVGASDLPALGHLELWLGVAQYVDTTVDDLAPILAGARLPRLTTLGLRAADLADQIAEELAGAPVVARLHTLDLSLGTLTDRGGEALLTGQPLTHLKKLDLHFHYLSDEIAARIVAELPDTDVDVPDQQREFDDFRYIAAGE